MGTRRKSRQALSHRASRGGELGARRRRLRLEDVYAPRLPSLPLTGLPPRQPGLHPGLTRGQTETLQPAPNGKQERVWLVCMYVYVCVRARKPCPREATGGRCGSAQGCQSRRRGAGEEGACRSTVAEQGARGKGRLYKFLGFMTVPRRWRNVHSIWGGREAGEHAAGILSTRMKCRREYLLAKNTGPQKNRNKTG